MKNRKNDRLEAEFAICKCISGECRCDKENAL